MEVSSKNWEDSGRENTLFDEDDWRVKGAPSTKIMVLVWKLEGDDRRRKNKWEREEEKKRRNLCKEKEPISGNFVMNCLRKKNGFSWGFSFLYSCSYYSKGESVQILH